MEPQHHNKIMIVIGVLVAVVVIVIGLVAIRGGRVEPTVQPVVTEPKIDRQAYEEATTVTAEKPTRDPMTQTYIKNTSAAKDSVDQSDSEREAYIRATSGQ